MNANCEKLPKSVKVRSTCNACQQAKIRCSHEKPSCRRCQKQRIECIYSMSRRLGRPAKRRDFPDRHGHPHEQRQRRQQKRQKQQCSTPKRLASTSRKDRRNVKAQDVLDNELMPALSTRLDESVLSAADPFGFGNTSWLHDGAELFDSLAPGTPFESTLAAKPGEVGQVGSPSLSSSSSSVPSSASLSVPVLSSPSPSSLAASPAFSPAQTGAMAALFAPDAHALPLPLPPPPPQQQQQQALQHREDYYHRHRDEMFFLFPGSRPAAAPAAPAALDERHHPPHIKQNYLFENNSSNDGGERHASASPGGQNSVLAFTSLSNMLDYTDTPEAAKTERQQTETGVRVPCRCHETAMLELLQIYASCEDTPAGPRTTIEALSRSQTNLTKLFQAILQCTTCLRIHLPVLLLTVITVDRLAASFERLVSGCLCSAATSDLAEHFLDRTLDCTLDCTWSKSDNLFDSSSAEERALVFKQTVHSRLDTLALIVRQIGECVQQDDSPCSKGKLIMIMETDRRLQLLMSSVV